MFVRLSVRKPPPYPSGDISLLSNLFLPVFQSNWNSMKVSTLSVLKIGGYIVRLKSP